MPVAKEKDDMFVQSQVFVESLGCSLSMLANTFKTQEELEQFYKEILVAFQWHVIPSLVDKICEKAKAQNKEIDKDNILKWLEDLQEDTMEKINDMIDTLLKGPSDANEPTTS